MSRGSIKSQDSIPHIERSADEFDQRLSPEAVSVLGATGLKQNMEAEVQTDTETTPTANLAGIPEPRAAEALDEHNFGGFARTQIMPKAWFTAIRCGLNRDACEDVVQDTALRVWENRKNVDSCQVVDRYVKTIARNCIIDTYRKDVNREGREQSVYSQTIASKPHAELNEGLQPTEIDRHGELFSIIERLLKTGAGHGRVFSEKSVENYIDLLMALSNGVTQAEYANNRKISAGTVKSWMSTIRTKLDPYMDQLHRYAAGEESQLVA